jgi:hypothetical protein
MLKNKFIDIKTLNVEQEFCGNKYFKGYIFIIERAKNRVLPEDLYTEQHHIFPPSIYGDNNIKVELDAKEHFYVHYMLWKGYREKYGTKDSRTRRMAYAFTFMRTHTKDHKRYKITTAREYEQLRIAASEARKGIPRTKEAKKKISENHADIGGENNPMYGTCSYKIHLEKYGKEEADKRKNEAKRKFSENYSKKVLQFDLNNNFIKEWRSFKEIENQLHYCHSSISLVCSGKAEKAYGFIWRYKDI